MSNARIKQFNDKQFLIDLKKVRDVMVKTDYTKTFFKIRKIEVLDIAKNGKVSYYLTDEVFRNKRTVMVVF